MSDPEPPPSCPRDQDCPANIHDTYSAYRQGCRSGAARHDAARYRREYRDITRRVTHWQDPHTDSTGSVRRLRALAVLGWPTTHIARHLDVTIRRVATVRERTHARVTVATHQRIAALYRDLAGHPGPDQATARRARRSGWDGPAAWDDGSIDDPSATPCTDDHHEQGPDGGLVEAALALGLRWSRLSKADREELVAGLHDRRTEAEIADYLHTTPAEIKKVWDRICGRRRRHDAAAQLAAAPDDAVLEHDGDDQGDGEQEDAA